MDRQKQVMIMMAVAVIILGIFVFIEVSNQQALINLLKICDYNKIGECYLNEHLYGIPCNV